MLKLLIIKTSSLGDVVHNLPIIADIKQYDPNAEIDWVAEESFADIPRLHSGVNQVIPVAMRRWRKQLFNAKTWAEISATKKKIATKKYDVILDTQGLIKSGVIATWANGKRHGYNWSSARESLASCFYNEKYNVPKAQHAVKRNRTLAAKALGYTIPDSAPDYGAFTMPTKEIDLPRQYVICLHGTSRDDKLWPSLNWIALGRALAGKQLDLVLPWASQTEFQRAQEIASKLTNARVTPKLGIQQLIPIIHDAKAAIGVDTGLSHLSAALNIPTIAIYTGTDPTLTGIMPGNKAPAVNLGGVGQTPSAESVIQAFNQIRA